MEKRSHIKTPMLYPQQGSITTRAVGPGIWTLNADYVPLSLVEDATQVPDAAFLSVGHVEDAAASESFEDLKLKWEEQSRSVPWDKGTMKAGTEASSSQIYYPSVFDASE